LIYHYFGVLRGKQVFVYHKLHQCEIDEKACAIYLGVNFINVFCRFVCTKVFLALFSSYVLALAKNLYKKRERLTLMKLMAAFLETLAMSFYCT